jgi:hypothetical protein
MKRLGEITAQALCANLHSAKTLVYRQSSAKRNPASNPVCGSAPTAEEGHALLNTERHSKEISMYYGGGLLGTIVIIAVIVWFVRRV